jgi:hypothetical protein
VFEDTKSEPEFFAQFFSSNFSTQTLFGAKPDELAFAKSLLIL